MIIIRTNQNVGYSHGQTKKNHYVCPYCEKEIIFGTYAPVTCSECKGSICNLEKLLENKTNAEKIKYYNSGKI